MKSNNGHGLNFVKFEQNLYYINFCVFFFFKYSIYVLRIGLYAFELCLCIVRGS